jgi:hypothetical protein
MFTDGEVEAFDTVVSDRQTDVDIGATVVGCRSQQDDG